MPGLQPVGSMEDCTSEQRRLFWQKCAMPQSTSSPTNCHPPNRSDQKCQTGKKIQATTFPPDNCVLRFRFADGVFSQELESFLKENLIFYVTEQLCNS